MGSHRFDNVFFAYGWLIIFAFVSIGWVRVATAESAVYGGISCSAWDFTSDGGFEGGESVASTSCVSTGGGDVELELSVGCVESGLNIRFSAPHIGDSDATIIFEFGNDAGGAGYVRELRRSRYEDADGALAAYVFFPDPLIKYLRDYAVTGVGLEDWQDNYSIGLKGSKVAIGKVLSACGADAVADAGPLVVEPIDEGGKEFEDSVESFFSFRERLLEGVKARDPSFMFSRLSDTIKVSFGGDGGPDEFKSLFVSEANSQLESPPAHIGANWKELEGVLSGGGLFYFSEETRGFNAPYQSSANWDIPDYLEEKYPIFEAAFLIEADVPIRTSMGADSEVLRTASYEVVRILEVFDDENGLPKSYRVALWDDEEGFVEGQYVRWFLGRWASFEEDESGQWIITKYLAGD